MAITVITPTSDNKSNGKNTNGLRAHRCGTRWTFLVTIVCCCFAALLRSNFHMINLGSRSYYHQQHSQKSPFTHSWNVASNTTHPIVSIHTNSTTIVENVTYAESERSTPLLIDSSTVPMHPFWDWNNTTTQQAEIISAPQANNVSDDTRSQVRVNETVLEDIFRIFTRLKTLELITNWSKDGSASSCTVDYLKRFRRSSIPYDASYQRSDCSPLPGVLRKSQDLTNLSTVVRASSDDCDIAFFGKESACQVVSRDDLTILFVGSSVIRQIVVAMGITLTDNMFSGGLRYLPEYDHTADTWQSLCACHNQWDCSKPRLQWMGKYMHRFSYNDKVSFSNKENLCGSGVKNDWHPYQILYVQMYDGPSIVQELRDIARHISSTGEKVVIVSDATALSGGVNMNKTRAFLGDLMALFPTTVLLIPMTIHYVGKNLPRKFYEKQGPEPVEAYNEELREFSKAIPQAKVLDTYNLTKFVESADSVHYPGINVALSQLLLNYIVRYANTTSTSSDPSVSSRRAKS